MFSAVTGFLAGFVHVLAGPDHLAAMAPLAVERPRRAWTLGLQWGMGHAGGVLLVGLLALLLRGILPIERLSFFSERLVGVVLIGIGLWGLHKVFGKQVHTHTHTHDHRRHEHIHIHDRDLRHANPRAHRHTHAAFAVGTLHGLAGSSHLLGILPALAFSSNAAAIGYIVAFGCGTILAMGTFSSLLGWFATRFAVGNDKAYRGLLGGCSTAAIAVGGIWLLI